MHDFGKIVYLDVEKTGSTFISHFLRQNLLLKERAFKKHARVARRRASASYLISVREPLAQYISLYQYGLDGKGRLAQSISPEAHARYYQANSSRAFEHWLAKMLDPAEPFFTGDPYLRLQPGIFGLQTYRFLKLAVPGALRRLKKQNTKQALQGFYDAKKLPTHVVKTENLSTDLENLAHSELGPFFKPREQVSSFLRKTARINKSTTNSAFQPDKLSPDLVGYLKEKEWFIYENFYP